MKKPVTLQQAIVYFGDADRAFEYAKWLRWPDGKVRPALGRATDRPQGARQLGPRHARAGDVRDEHRRAHHGGDEQRAGVGRFSKGKRGGDMVGTVGTTIMIGS